VLKPEIIEQVKADQVLFGKVAKAANISIRRLLDVINEERTAQRLTGGAIAPVIEKHLGLKYTQITQEIQACE